MLLIFAVTSNYLLEVGVIHLSFTSAEARAAWQIEECVSCFQLSSSWLRLAPLPNSNQPVCICDQHKQRCLDTSCVRRWRTHYSDRVSSPCTRLHGQTELVSYIVCSLWSLCSVFIYYPRWSHFHFTEGRWNSTSKEDANLFLYYIGCLHRFIHTNTGGWQHLYHEDPLCQNGQKIVIIVDYECSKVSLHGIAFKTKPLHVFPTPSPVKIRHWPQRRKSGSALNPITFAVSSKLLNIESWRSSWHQKSQFCFLFLIWYYFRLNLICAKFL